MLSRCNSSPDGGSAWRVTSKLIWVGKALKAVYTLGQEQVWGFSPAWVRMWVLRWSEQLRELPLACHTWRGEFGILSAGTHTHIHTPKHARFHAHTHTVSHEAMYLLWRGCLLQSSQWTALLHDRGRTWEQCTQHQEHCPHTGSPDSSLCIITMATEGDKKPMHLSPSAQ